MRYLLKPGQVPINEFIKMRLAFDDRRNERLHDEKKRELSTKRYLELATQFTCTNKDNRLILEENLKRDDVGNVLAKQPTILARIKEDQARRARE